MVKIGVLGGTFDPVHNGHLIVAEEAKTRFNLIEVIFVPAGQPWLKTDKTITLFYLCYARQGWKGDDAVRKRFIVSTRHARGYGILPKHKT